MAQTLSDIKKRMLQSVSNGTMTVSPMLNTMKCTNKGLMFRLWWKERVWQTLKLTLSPKFYFYKLFHDTLPFQKNRSRSTLIEELETCLEDMEFTLEMKDEDKEGYSSLYEKENVVVDLSKFYEMCDMKNQKVLSYKGCVNVEITITESGSVETEVTFYSEDLNLNEENVKDWSHHLNHVTLGHIQFQ